MSGAAAGVAVLAVATVVAGAVAAVGPASVRMTRAVGVADAPALAAADAVSGRLSGVPCERADEATATAGAGHVACDVDGGIATVRMRVDLGPALGGGGEVLGAEAQARAGPPPAPRTSGERSILGPLRAGSLGRPTPAVRRVAHSLFTPRHGRTGAARCPSMKSR